MSKYCPICLRKVSTYRSGKIYRHGFKKNRWIFDGAPFVDDIDYRKVDSSPCAGSGKYGLTLKQVERKKDVRKK